MLALVNVHEIVVWFRFRMALSFESCLNGKLKTTQRWKKEKKKYKELHAREQRQRCVCVGGEGGGVTLTQFGSVKF